jgi:hypothetical protein
MRHNERIHVVNRRTHLQLLIDTLREQNENQASPQRLSTLLNWDIEKVRRIARQGDDDPSVPVHIAKGGVVKYRGSERGASVGIYSDIANVFSGHWARQQLGLRNIVAVVTAKSGTRGAGVWTHPDLVVAADPRRKKVAGAPPDLHAIEVETAEGFDLKSVYQAHAQGRGANFSWVFGSKAPHVEPPDWERVLWTVEELNIGLVTFEKAHAGGTWSLVRSPAWRHTSDVEREAFLNQTTSASDRRILGY